MTAAIIIMIIVAGIIFIAIELFLIPGFSVPGLVGIAMIGYGIFKAQVEYGITGMLSGLIFSALASILLIRYSLKSSVAKKIGLDFNIGGARATDDYSSLLGKEGTALTSLRPSGLAIVDGKRCDVVTDGEFIAAETELTVVAVEGTRIVVAAKKPHSVV